MPIKMEPPAGKIGVARVSGKMVKADLDAFQQASLPAMQEKGDARVLILLEDFEGWEAGSGWADTQFIETNDKYLSKMAIVGPEEWRDQALMFTLASMRPVDIRFFLPDEEAVARVWLDED